MREILVRCGSSVARARGACIAGLIIFMWIGFFVPARAGGIALGASRVVHSLSALESTLDVRNTDSTKTFLLQVWLEQPDGRRSTDFVVTPPLHRIAPRTESVLRVIAAGTPLPRAQESLYYLNIKVIPEGKNPIGEDGGAHVAIGTVIRIKLIVRPDSVPAITAAIGESLIFNREKERLVISNPTPHYLTLSDLRAGARLLGDAIIAPSGTATFGLSADDVHDMTWNTVGDGGEILPVRVRIAPLAYAVSAPLKKTICPRRQ